MLVVDFAYVTEGKVFKEMVQDLQYALVTGGVHTNAFRPKRKNLGAGKITAPENQIVFYVDGRREAEQAAAFLRE